jgi:hypothetical protein
VVTAGGNDLFLRKGGTSYTGSIMSMFEEMVGKVKEKTDKCIITGLIPRMHFGGEAHSKTVVINKRHVKLCLSKNLRFLDLGKQRRTAGRPIQGCSNPLVSPSNG